MNEAMIQYVREFTEPRDAGAMDFGEKKLPFRRLFGHCFRTMVWAQRINHQELGDPAIVEIAALFHDIGRCVVDKRKEDHAKAGAKVCGEYLASIGFDAVRTERIVEIVRHHPHDGRKRTRSLEEKIVRDADLLDETGVLALVWDAMSEALTPDTSYDKVYEHLAGSLKHLKEHRYVFETGTAEKLYQERLDMAEQCYRQLGYELGREER